MGLFVFSVFLLCFFFLTADVALFLIASAVPVIQFEGAIKVRREACPGSLQIFSPYVLR